MRGEWRSLMVPIMYVLTLIIDVAYTFQVELNFKFNFTASGLANLILIALIVGGIWGLENIAILRAEEEGEGSRRGERGGWVK